MKRRFTYIVLTALATAISFINSAYPAELVLQHIPTLFALGILAIVTVKFRLSTLSLSCCLTFLWLHIIDSRWLYSYVPYDDWARSLFGSSLSDIFSWRRNHYDRLVHLAFGILAMHPVSEFLQTFNRLRPWEAALGAMLAVLAISAVYEILEWQIALLFAPQLRNLTTASRAISGTRKKTWLSPG